MMPRAVFLSLFSVLVFSCFTAYGQEREVQKLERWQQKGKYEKVLKKGRAYLRKYPRHSQLWMAMAEAEGHLAQTSPERLRHRHFQAAMKHWATAVRYYDDTNGPISTPFATWLRDSLRLSASEAYEAQRYPQAKNYSRFLIINFADTLSFANELLAWDFEPDDSDGNTGGAAAPVRVTSIPSWAQQSNNPFTFPEVVPPRDSVLAVAARLKGIPYKWAGEKPATGFDCSGFVLYVMRTQGYDFLHGTRFVKELGWEIEEQDAQPGDIVLFGGFNADGTARISHMGILYRTGEGQRQVVHCVSRGVVIDNLNEGDYWTDKIVYFRNILDPNTPQGNRSRGLSGR